MYAKIDADILKICEEILKTKTIACTSCCAPKPIF